MKELKLAVVLWVLILAASEFPRYAITAAVQDGAQPESKTVSFADATEAPAEPAAAATGRRRLSDREARRLGVTFLSVRAALKELKAAGTIDGSECNAELSAIVADHISSKKENAAAFKATAIDWDALISFISRLLEIILKFFQ